MHKHLLRSVAAFLLIALPSPLIAAVFIEAQDSIAGLGLEAEVRGLVPAQQFTLHVTSPDGHTMTIPSVADAQGTKIVDVNGAETEVAGRYVLTAEDSSGHSLGTSQADVLPDTVDQQRSTIIARPASIEPDGRDEAHVTVTLVDRYGNPLAGRPVTLLSSRTSDEIFALDSETNDEGDQQFAVTTTQAGTISLRAVDLLSGIALSSSAKIEAGAPVAAGNYGYPYPYAPYPPYPYPVYPQPYPQTRSPFGAQLSSYDVIDAFEIDAPRGWPAGLEIPNVTVRAVDQFGNTVEDYVGTVRFRSSDKRATLPLFDRGYTFRDVDLGEHDFPLTVKFQETGFQTFRVEDINDPRIFGEVDIDVTGSAHPAGNIEITSHEDWQAISGLDIVLEGKGPKFANLIVTGGEKNVVGTTDNEGNFSIPIRLSDKQKDFTITVRDSAERNESIPLHLTFDQESPEIVSVTFSPERPQASEKVLVVVQSEPKLAQVTLKLLSPKNVAVQEVTLAENTTASGSYQAFFTAPVSGSYKANVSVMDKAGNVAQVQTPLLVGVTGLPKVLGVKATGKANAVALEWESLKESVDEYRVYVGDKPNNFLYTLETQRPTNKATVAGLTPGRTYYFAVTALKDEAESTEKSDVIEARTAGISLKVTEQDGSLLLDWSEFSAGAPLSSFILEYGVESEKFTEKRILHGELKTTVLRDLLNGITYYLRLTPVTVTGDELKDIAARGQGTPQGAGFALSPADPIPFDPSRPPVSPKPPLLDPEGLPSMAWLAIVALSFGAAVAYWRHKRTLRQASEFLDAIQSRYH